MYIKLIKGKIDKRKKRQKEIGENKEVN